MIAEEKQTTSRYSHPCPVCALSFTVPKFSGTATPFCAPKVLVCDPRKNALLKVGNHNHREDARKLSELLYLNKLNPVYHGETGIRTLKELARS
jgi:hypothetical protein